MTRPAILILDDNETFARALRRGLHQRFSVTLANTIEAAKTGIGEGVDLAVVDVVLDEEHASTDRSGLDFVRWVSEHAPDTPMIVLTGHGADELEVEALRLGAADCIEKDGLKLELLEAKILALLERAELRSRNRELTSRLEEYEPHVLIGTSATIAAFREQIGQLAQADATVLITGESGAGKEVVARAIHHASARRNGPFLAVNCAALNAGLLESELFGHERGAFTGAVDRRVGLFESAHSGMLLLDEITEMDIGLQAKLLRVLEENTIQRLGSSNRVEVDVRVIATTNRNPEATVQDGHLRRDVFYRLNVLPIHVPPLRDHMEDIPVLVDHFVSCLQQKLQSQVRKFSRRALQSMAYYEWPGNVRELRNVVERALTLCQCDEVPFDLLAPWLRSAFAYESSLDDNDLNVERRAAFAQLEAIACALDRAGGVKKEAQRLLGFEDRSTLRRTVHRLRVDFPGLWLQFPILVKHYGEAEAES